MKVITSILFMYGLISQFPIVNSNAVILLADDLGTEIELYGDYPCKTPHLKELSSGGTLYTNTWTAVSSCSPSRASILTGLPPHQNGMVGLHQGYHNFQSYNKVRSLPNLLKDKNIRTGIIGKKHVGPNFVYTFDYEETEENNSILQVGRNITYIIELVRTFLNTNDTRPFLLYVGFHDPHRCGHTHPQYGSFCEKFGTGEENMGNIPDWLPVTYTTEDVLVPYFVQDTPVTRKDLAAQYTTISRLDQGVGLVMKELRERNILNDTLVIFTSDNGSPYPSGRTNVYEPGLQVPLIISSPKEIDSWGNKSNALTSLLDITPTVLKWFNVSYPNYTIFGKNGQIKLTGQSLLSVIQNGTNNNRNYTYASHNLHEITMYYPMRAIRNERFKLIQNIAYRMPFPIDQDFFVSPVFQDILNRSLTGNLTWYKTLYKYYNRPQWELFDIDIDFMERNNMAGKPHYKNIFYQLQAKLREWQNVTQDPWICAPGCVLQDAGPFRDDHKCFSLFNGL